MPNCKNIVPNYKVIDGKGRNLSNRKYCLECSPYNRHNTRKLHIKENIEKLCPRCKTIKPIKEFYKARSKPRTNCYCKVCANIQTIERQRAFKSQCIEYKGGKCSKCGYHKCNAALEFHHIDASKKDFHISNVKLKTFDQIVKNELDKCICICANCHRELHWEKYSTPDRT